MKVLILSSEVAPFAKTGGLADVAGALPLALARLGIDVRVAMPEYGSIDYTRNAPLPVLPYMEVQLGWRSFVATVAEGKLPDSKVPVYFLGNPGLFNRKGLYQEDGRDYPDNAQRFAFFCKAAVWMIKGLNWIPDVIHCNDWQTGPLPMMLKTDPGMKNDLSLSKIRTLFTLHNLGYQGTFSPRTLDELGFAPEVYHPDGMEFYGSLNFLKGGLVYSDLLTTVSPTYANEIQTPEFGCGLDGVLQQKSNKLSGILNGIDFEQWNPETDTHLPAHFRAGAMDNKAKCKASLQKELGLTLDPSIPLLIMISRLDPQKGLDILIPLLDKIMSKKVQIAVLGTGLPEYHDALQKASDNYPGRMAVRLKFDNGLAHRMEAGADIFLMPSRYEPCGLNQLYSLRYGTLPIVRKTGGLADSVEPASRDGSEGTGFLFNNYSSRALMDVIDEALRVYENRDAWSKLQYRGMTRDFSWDDSARRYAALYTQLVG